MRHLLIAAWLVALLGAGGVGNAHAYGLKTWGYLVWWLPDAWRSIELAQLDRLIFFELKANANGQIDERQGWPEQWQPLKQALAKSGTRLELALSILDGKTFKPLFTSREARRTLHAQAMELAAQDGVAGLHLDFEVYETVDEATLAGLRSFVVQLARALNQLKPARNLSVFYPMGADSQLYDRATLAVFSHIVVQGYDAHWLEGPTAGPVAPLRGPQAVTWEKALAQLLEQGVAREKLLFGFPLYGYEWPVKAAKPALSHASGTIGQINSAQPNPAQPNPAQPNPAHPGTPTSGKGSTLTFASQPAGRLPDISTSVRQRVQQYGAMHDPLSASSYYRFTRPDGQSVEGWLEDWWSLARKSEFLSAEKLGGIAFFPLGYDQDELLDYFLRQQQKPPPAPAPAPAPANPVPAIPEAVPAPPTGTPPKPPATPPATPQAAPQAIMQTAVQSAAQPVTPPGPATPAPATALPGPAPTPAASCCAK